MKITPWIWFCRIAGMIELWAAFWFSYEKNLDLVVVLLVSAGFAWNCRLNALENRK